MQRSIACRLCAGNPREADGWRNIAKSAGGVGPTLSTATPHPNLVGTVAIYQNLRQIASVYQDQLLTR